MPIVTILFALILIVMGVGGYLGTDRVSPTALIPAAFGVLFLLCGILALKESLLKHAMHGAAMLGVLSILGTLRGVFQLFGGDLERPIAVYMQAGMCLLSIIFVGLCVKSFIDVRKRREAEANAGQETS
jgi:cation transport ATPase